MGEKEQEIKEQIRTLGLDNAVRFLGSRSDVNELYQAMDVFVMPSFFEGIPVTGVEAQFAELPCIFSTKVPQEVSFTDKCKFLTLEESTERWAEVILNINSDVRLEGSITAKNSWYNIKNAKSILVEYYNNISLEEK